MVIPLPRTRQQAQAAKSNAGWSNCRQTRNIFEPLAFQAELQQEAEHKPATENRRIA